MAGLRSSSSLARPPASIVSRLKAPSSAAPSRLAWGSRRMRWLAAPPTALGKNTSHSMQSGIVFGHVGLVEGLVTRLRAELPGGARAKVIAHGGLADLMTQVTPCIDIVDPNLILAGLRIAYQRLRASDRATTGRAEQ